MAGIMNRTRRRNIRGMVVYMCIAMLFGGFRLLALIVHEDNDRCHNYNGTWNVGDLVCGCGAA